MPCRLSTSQSSRRRGMDRRRSVPCSTGTSRCSRRRIGMFRETLRRTSAVGSHSIGCLRRRRETSPLLGGHQRNAGLISRHDQEDGREEAQEAQKVPVGRPISIYTGGWGAVLCNRERRSLGGSRESGAARGKE